MFKPLLIDCKQFVTDKINPPKRKKLLINQL